ncbi:hypothetical protein [Pararhodobacter sp. SW119]|uniref:hypothetical protein n=1 Tax=Pararhodobacter sp. SW119 TaxID=2780075 RepID=UPI001AE092D1|nr:hypothetical protein [Pararhodobacter sp. SW119]
MYDIYLQALAVFFGCFILVCEAWREYENSDAINRLKSSNQPKRKELENVRISALTTKPEYKRGRWIYIVCFVFLYFLLITIPEIAGMLIRGGAAADIADGGANSRFRSWVNSSEAGSLQGSLSENPTLPVSLAIAMVIGVTTPTFTVVERSIRSLAYVIAGVPRNIYSVLENLEGLNYRDYARGENLPLYEAFERKDEQHKLSEDGSADLIRSISEALRIVDLLQSPVIGPRRNVFRTVFLGESPMERIDDLRARYTQIRTKIADLDNAELREQTLDALQQESTDLAGSMQCLFALYAIRSKAIPEILKGTPQERIIHETTRGSARQSLDDIAVASILGAIFSVFLVALYARYLLGVAGVAVDSETAVGVRDFTRRILFPLLPSLFVVSLMTVFRRHAKLDQGTYPKLEENRVPFWAYAKLVALPTLLGTFLYIVLMVANTDASRLLLGGLFGEGRDLALSFIGAELYQLPRIVALFFFYSCGLLIIADQHEKMPWYITIGVVGTILVWLLFMVLSVFPILNEDAFKPKSSVLLSNHVTLMFFLPVAVTLYFYAAAAEFAEKGQMRRFVSAARNRRWFGGIRP